MRSAFRRALVAGVTLSALVSATVGCSSSPAEDDVDLTLVIGGQGEFGANLNPLQGGFPPSGLFDSLLYWDEADNTWQPRLAKEVTFSDDRTTIDVVLRDDVEFVDGEHLTAAGVKEFFEALFASEYALNGSLLPYEPIIEVTGEYEFRVSTSKPVYYGDFGRAFFSWVPIVSPGAIDDPKRAAAEPLGSGPYLIDEFDPSTELTLVRNPDYWDPDAFPYDTIVIKVLTDPTARLNALKSGQVDVAPISIQQAAEVEASGLLVEQASTGYDALIVWDPVGSSVEALRDVRVRRAISMAFDREAILESVYLGYGEVSDQIFPPASPAYVGDGDLRYEYDPQAARELLAESGYADGFDLTVVGPSAMDISPIVQQSLADIGIRMTFAETADWFGDAMKGSQPAILFSGFVFTNNLRYLTEVFPGLGSWLKPTPEIEELVSTIKSGSAEDAADAAQELGEFLLDEAWIIPIAQPATLWAHDTTVDILRIRPLEGPALWDLAPVE